ncbi:tuftelin-interacting protein 11-like [Ostrea edulis]|uniref:tuftelin-interacting protein 11-like n=1 Tax=Ostrea edulis TaxID=37623 RepID=UPI0024AEB822|nr:tuftelin-interacting protein 11-like [Ostrea edulis]XP_056016658.1 tuftelin-interacting protein 11-like [Ostrea edulis]
MSSPEVEKFEVTEDDLANEFYPRGGRRQTKNQAIYGMWANSDDEDNTPGFGGGRRKRKDYTAPIGFVSGGIKQGSKIKKEGEGEEDSSDSEKDIQIQMPSKQFLSRTSRPQGRSGKQFAGFGKTDVGFGDWERHTRGVGKKLLEKMGFKPGEGLGKHGQGITTPVEAVKRKGKAAVGAYGTERSERSLVDFPVHDSDEEEEKKFKDELSQWKKKPEVGKKKPKYVYKTAEEIIQSGVGKKKSMPSKASKVKVIDMTGKEKRVLSGYHAIATRHNRPDEEEDLMEQEPGQKKAFEMPELMHNLNILVDMAEEDIITNDRKLRYEKDHIVNMRHEKERLDTICDQEEAQIQKLKSVLDIVRMCEERTQPGCDDPLQLDECAAIFSSLQNDFYEEYKMYDLSSLAVALVFPMMRKYFSTWDPLKEPEYGLDTIRQWKILLEDYNQQYAGNANDMDVFQRLLWDVWLPYLRTTILKWNVRVCNPIIEVLETWLPVLPPWIMENIFDQLVLPRLLQEVENWNPLTDTMPIHAWLHPWLPLMKDKLEPLYAPIRHKIANALINWHPSDASAKVILQPWVRVFKPGHLEAFLVKNILPKLAMCMQEFVINPHQQILDPWHWVMAWSDIIPAKYMVDMLEKTFFPKWRTVLCTWLSNMPNYDEITKWYLGWKSLFSEEYLSQPSIRDNFSKALEIMNRAVSSHIQPGVKENMAYFSQMERRQMADASVSSSSRSPPRQTATGPEPTYTRSVTVGSNYQPTFKDLVEKAAEENGLLFMPIAGKTQEAKQVYRYGKVQIYLDRNVIFVFENLNWIPVSLQNLVMKAKP